MLEGVFHRVLHRFCGTSITETWNLQIPGTDSAILLAHLLPQIGLYIFFSQSLASSYCSNVRSSSRNSGVCTCTRQSFTRD